MVGSPVNSQNFTHIPNKFLCSYGGRILPRYPDGKLRYHGGETRVLSVDRSITFSELLVKLGEMCGSSVSLRCQLPTEDLDALVSITSDEDLANLIDEYDRAAGFYLPSPLKIRAFLSAPKASKKSSSPPSSASSSSNSSASPRSRFYSIAGGGGPLPRCPLSANCRCICHASRPLMYSGEKAAGKVPIPYGYQGQYHHHHVHGTGSPVYVIQHDYHRQ